MDLHLDLDASAGRTLRARAEHALREAVRSGKGAPTARRLADEILAAYKGEGAAMQTRENVHRMAEANKAFAHFAW